MMFVTGIFAAIYVLIAILAAAMTYAEQRKTNGRSPLFTVLGYLACALWPVVFLTAAVAAQLRTT